MIRVPVHSSDIVSIGYDKRNRILEIEFKEDRIYQYADVEPEVHEQFMRADSYGEFFYASISRRYKYKRINGVVSEKETPRALAIMTGNHRKFQWCRMAFEPFGIEVEQLRLPVDEIQSHDPRAIALRKAKDAYKIAKRPVVVNDVVWNILALKGFPGAFMNYVEGWLTSEDFLALMANKTDRTIGRTDTLVYYDGKHSKVYTKDHWGKIIDKPRGEGLPIDRVIIMTGQTKTVAERYGEDNLPTVPIEDSVWHEFAKWFSVQRRLGRA